MTSSNGKQSEKSLISFELKKQEKKTKTRQTNKQTKTPEQQANIDDMVTYMAGSLGFSKKPKGMLVFFRYFETKFKINKISFCQKLL